MVRMPHPSRHMRVRRNSRFLGTKSWGGRLLRGPAERASMAGSSEPRFPHRIGCEVPPTGIALFRELEARCGGLDFVSELAMLSGRTRGSVEWLLQQKVVVPAGLFCAASVLKASLATKLG